METGPKRAEKATSIRDRKTMCLISVYLGIGRGAGVESCLWHAKAMVFVYHQETGKME